MRAVSSAIAPCEGWKRRVEVKGESEEKYRSRFTVAMATKQFEGMMNGSQPIVSRRRRHRQVIAW